MTLPEKEWRDFTGHFGQSQEYPVSFEPVGIAGEEMFTHLCELVVPKDKSAHSQKTRERLFRLYQFTRDAMRTVGKDKRHSGDDIMTHPLSIAIMLSEMGITDEDIIDAAIVHDVPEDTRDAKVAVKYDLRAIANLIDNIDSDPHHRRGKNVAGLVDTVSKVKTTVKTQRLQQVPPEMISQFEDELTLRKLLYALVSDPRAIIIKLGDVAHNAMTLSAMPVSTQVRKAGIFLNYYEPLARNFGMIGLARIIGDSTLETVQKKAAGEIKTARDNLNANQRLKELRQMTNDWEFDAWQKRQKLNFQSVDIDVPSLYEIYKKLGKSKTPAIPDLLPTVRVTVENRDDVWNWYTYLAQKYDFTAMDDMKKAYQDMLHEEKIIKQIPYKINGNIFCLNVEISPKIAEMMPVHLYMKGLRLTPKEKQVIERKMGQLRKSYIQSFHDKKVGHYSRSQQAHEDFTDRLKAGTVRFLDKDRKERAIKSGATYLDAAYEIGENLGNSALSVMIKLPGKKRWLSRKLTDIVEPDAQCQFIARKAKRLKNYVYPSRYDMVNTPKAIRNIKDILKYLESHPKVEKDAHQRGGEILFWLYEMIRGKQPDISFSNVFDQSSLQKKYGDLNNFKKIVGMTPIPALNGNYFPLWQGREALDLASGLVDFRKNLWSVRIKKKDAPGILTDCSGIIAGLGGNILPVRTEVSPDDDDVTIQFTLTTGGSPLAHEIELALRKKYGKDAVIKIQ